MTYTVHADGDGYVLCEDGSEVARYDREPTQDEARGDAVINELQGPGGLKAALRFLVDGHVTFRQTNG